MLIPATGAALPIVKTLSDCANFTQTVSPFLPQLKTFPTQVFSNIDNLEALKAIYLSTNPLISGLALSLFLAPVFLVVSEINKNYSQVDRFWSILPTVYNAHYALWARMNGLPTQRLDNILAWSCLWSARLTFNYWRKGGYSIGSEDYRWEILRARISPPLFFIFNVLFISLAQSLLLWMITTPTYTLLLVSRQTGQNMDVWDALFARLLISLVLLETFADQQQWNYQQAKKQYQSTAKVPSGYDRAALDRGFVTSGLWAWSRHPNFAAEQAIWFVLYNWAAFASNAYVSWTMLGALAYCALFQASTRFTEEISAGKYPEYETYQRRVGQFFPKLWSSEPRGMNGEAEGAEQVKAKAGQKGRKSL